MTESATLAAIRIMLGAGRRADGSTAGLYAINCLGNGRLYIGSSVRVADRLGRHKRDLRAGRHHCAPLQRAWDKYGEAAFSIDLLMVTTVTGDLLEWEQAYLSCPIHRPFLFNTCFVAGTCEGRPQSRETIEKRAASLRGGTRTPEQRRRISEARKLAFVSPEGRENIAAAMARRRFTFGPDDLAEAIRMRMAGASLSALQRRFAVSRHAIKRELEAANV